MNIDLKINALIESISAKTWSIEPLGNSNLLNSLFNIDKSKIKALYVPYYEADFLISPLFDFEIKCGLTRIKADYYPFYNDYDINKYGEDVCEALNIKYKDFKWGFETLSNNNFKIIGTSRAGLLTTSQREVIAKIENKLIQSKNYR